MLAYAVSAQVVINEIAPSATTLADEGGTFEDWVELYNPSGQDIDLGGVFASDDLAEPYEWEIPAGVTVPAGGYLVLFADKDPEQGDNHLDFSLKKSGEDLVLTDQNGNQLAAVSFPRVAFRASYARKSDGTYELVGTPSPGAANPTGITYLAPPTASVSSGAYAGAQTVALASDVPGATIYYTTDGSVPTAQSSRYDSPLTISATTSLRAIVTASGYADSRDETFAYLIDDTPTAGMSAIMLTSDPVNFFSDTAGIYVVGTNGVERYCASPGMPANYFQDWERPANFQMLLPDGSVAFDVDGETEINGVCSRRQPQKSLAISLKEKQYGVEDIDYPLFPQRGDDESYTRLKIRNGGQDWQRIIMRDMLNHSLLYGKMDIDVQLGRPTALYINGEFFGIHNLREKYREDYFNRGEYKVKDKDLMVIKSPGLFYAEVKIGPDSLSLAQNYNRLFDFVKTADMTDDANFDRFASEVDVNEMINYWTVMTYMGNRDWPGNNLTVWRDLGDDEGKWRYGVADTDGSSGSGLVLETLENYNTLAEVLDPDCDRVHCHSDATLFFRKALERDEWRDEFLQRNNTYIATTYSPERARHFVDSVAAIYDPDFQRQFERWPTQWSWIGAYPAWLDNYRKFYDERPAFYRGFLADAFGLAQADNLYRLTLGTVDTTHGTVYIHNAEQELTTGYTADYFKTVPLRLRAEPDSGYVFDRWLETGETDSLLMFVGTADQLLTPVFEAIVVPPDSSNSATNARRVASFRLSPNPARDVVQVELRESTSTTSALTVHDLLGRPVLRVRTEQQRTTIDVSGLPRGQYVVRREGEAGVRRFVKD